MLSLRSFARLAPRTVSRLSSSAIKRPASRPTASLLQSAWKPSRCAASFSTSIARRSAQDEGDAELAAKLQSEASLEVGLSQEETAPASLQDYLENGPFEVIDTPGQEEVVLTRTFRDEKIRVSFSIADLNALDPEEDYQDPAMADEADEGIKTTPEDQIEDDADNQQDQDPSFPARLNIVIEKASKGALAVEAAVQDGMVVIDNVYYYSDASLAHAKTAEKIQERQDMYVGPPFGNLDEDLQILFEKYLDERGINSALALFVPDYIDMKEQKEYVRWLENVKGFVEA